MFDRLGYYRTYLEYLVELLLNKMIDKLFALSIVGKFLFVACNERIVVLFWSLFFIGACYFGFWSSFMP